MHNLNIEFRYEIMINNCFIIITHKNIYNIEQSIGSRLHLLITLNRSFKNFLSI
jgi:hypothetical protein